MKINHYDKRKGRNSEDVKSQHTTPTKKRKRSLYNNTVKSQPESFVMKLFDRSLDLSKYSENTPLYPICRSWIANQPRNPNLLNFKEKKEPTKRENNGAELLNMIQRGERIIITAMPEPLNIEVQSEAQPTSPCRKHNLEILDEALKKETDSLGDEEMEEERIRILTEHKGQWKKAKSNYKQNPNDKRYALNQLIIKKLFKFS